MIDLNPSIVNARPTASQSRFGLELSMAAHPTSPSLGSANCTRSTFDLNRSNASGSSSSSCSNVASTDACSASLSGTMRGMQSALSPRSAFQMTKLSTPVGTSTLHFLTGSYSSTSPGSSETSLKLMM
jgi:hypothetical protein